MKTRSALVLALAALSLRVGAQDQTVFMDVAAENLFRNSRAAISKGGRTVYSLHTLILKGQSRFAVGDSGGR